MLLRFIGAGFCILIGLVAFLIVMVMPTPMIFVEPVARFAYIGLFAFLILVGIAAFTIMLTILGR